MSGKRRAEDEPLAEPSWLTAQSEADTASRRLAQAAKSLERLSRELTALREWGDTTARLDVAHALTDGPDGGALAVLTMAAATPTADGTLRRVAHILLERLADALGLEPIAERGDLLSLRPEELGEFEVRGRLADAAPGSGRVPCRVARPGWCLGDHIVVRPLLEPTAETSRPSSASPPDRDARSSSGATTRPTACVVSGARGGRPSGELPGSPGSRRGPC